MVVVQVPNPLPMCVHNSAQWRWEQIWAMQLLRFVWVLLWVEIRGGAGWAWINLSGELKQCISLSPPPLSSLIL